MHTLQTSARPDQPRRTFALGSHLRMAIAAITLLASLCAHARDLGVIGPVYAISEPSLIEVIQAKLREMDASGGLARLQRESQARIRREVEQPAPVAGITRATRARSFHFDPSIEVPYPILDADGRVIVAPGTRVNPLDTVSLSRPLLFIDARDSAQLERAQRELGAHKGQVKLILTGGSYLDLMRRWKLAVFYDQQGRLSTQLGIRHVPALVTQDGNRLRIDELL
ncbi:type-F conjugative transfer system protein TraW [Candidatus Skiveiella danica]|uniref:type-F conjugative transfer system protein TraW n=1 Tax=Candidatus Skiveiella danica TaxID=3386177 RepID=UPI0039B8A6D1